MALHQNNSSFRRKGLNLLNFEIVKARNKKDGQEWGPEQERRKRTKSNHKS